MLMLKSFKITPEFDLKACVPYIPVTSERHQKTVMFGDQGFFERGHNVSFSRSREANLTERLDGLVSIPQEWHKKRVI